LNLVFIFYAGFALFITGLFGVMHFKSRTLQLISVQLIIVSSIVNFLSFSQILYESPTSIIVFVLISVFLIIIFQFCIVFYVYSGLNEKKSRINESGNGLFYFGLEEWLGDK
jgi:NADH:ubiquinone oxidoreductase subunit K